MCIQPTLKGDAQLAEASKLGVGAFDHPTVPPLSLLSMPRRAYRAVAKVPDNAGSHSLCPHAVCADAGEGLQGDRE